MPDEDFLVNISIVTGIPGVHISQPLVVEIMV